MKNLFSGTFILQFWAVVVPLIFIYHEARLAEKLGDTCIVGKWAFRFYIASLLFLLFVWGVEDKIQCP